MTAWIGDAAFESSAAHHIDRLPPSHWTLDAYALDFPATLDLFYPNDPEVGELGRRECELGLAFIGPDTPLLDPTSLAEFDWDAAVLHRVPTFALRPPATNAGAIWSAISEGGAPPAARLLSAPVSMSVWRSGFAPAVRTPEAPESEALGLISEGQEFGALCPNLVERLGEDQGARLAGAFLGQWLADELVASVSQNG